MTGSPALPPEARTHLPKRIERYLVERYGGSTFGRIRGAAVLRALSVLVRRHPKATIDALWAGLVQAGRAGASEVKNRFTKGRGRKVKEVAHQDAAPHPKGEKPATLEARDRTASKKGTHRVAKTTNRQHLHGGLQGPASERSSAAVGPHEPKAASRATSRPAKSKDKGPSPRPNGATQAGHDDGKRNELLEKIGPRGLKRIRRDLELGQQ